MKIYITFILKATACLTDWSEYSLLFIFYIYFWNILQPLLSLMKSKLLENDWFLENYQETEEFDVPTTMVLWMMNNMIRRETTYIRTHTQTDKDTHTTSHTYAIIDMLTWRILVKILLPINKHTYSYIGILFYFSYTYPYIYKYINVFKSVYPCWRKIKKK